jgi:hypothetical protein
MGLRLFSFAVDKWTTDVLERAPRLAEQVERYDTIPDLFFAKTTEDKAVLIRDLEGVRSMTPSDEGTRRIVYSIDHQVKIAVMHREEVKPNGIANGAEAHHPTGIPKLPTLQMVDGTASWGFDEQLIVPTRLCMVGALNISLESTGSVDYRTDDPVCMAIEAAARELPVVIAAGNAKPGHPERRMLGWSQAPSVIAVGATDPDGTRIAAYSRIGDPQHQIAGPAVVANGTDESGEVGTSFAAPVASSQLVWLAAAYMLLRTVARQQISTLEPEGVPLAGRCFVDLDSMPGTRGHGAQVHDFAHRRRKLPCLPITAVNTSALRAVLTASGWEHSPLLRLPPPWLLRELLQQSAVGVPGASPHEGGSGFVSDSTTTEFLVKLDGATLGAREGPIEDAARRGLTEPLFDEALLRAFLAGARDSMIGWASDLKQFTVGDAQAVFVEKPPTIVREPSAVSQEHP